VDFNLVVVVPNEVQFPEPIHEEIDPPASRAHHLGESFLSDVRNRNLRLSLLPELRQQEKNTS